ncbi:BON domain-containing protein [Streptosporangium amethystogenes]|uniref:BON domain-containing protein n=1 Tax=Streptosporangium amethystogenes TaxID=2002 RepID=UPI0004CBFE0A|nr:BON domain-containing protein [Streptosporangium amethystogenes]
MEAPQYVAARVQGALAEDERTTELGVRVDVRNDQLYLRGQVTSADRRALIAKVAGEAAPGLVVHNEIDVVSVVEPVREEQL